MLWIETDDGGVEPCEDPILWAKETARRGKGHERALAFVRGRRE